MFFNSCQNSVSTADELTLMDVFKYFDWYSSAANIISQVRDGYTVLSEFHV